MGKLKRVREPISYEELKPGNNKIRNNTRSVENEDGTYSIYLHDNLIATIYFDGSVRIFSGGWHSRLTSQRLNRILHFTNWGLYTEKGQWMVCYYESSRKPPIRLPFKEGMLLSAGAYND